MADPAFLRVKGWRDWQHYKDRDPPWIKLHSNLRRDESFQELDEIEQWQLVRIWMQAAQSSRHTLDEQGRRVPVVTNSEQTLRRTIGTLKKIPLTRFIRDGWLITVSESDLVDPPDASAVLAKDQLETPECLPEDECEEQDASPLANAPARRAGTEGLENFYEVEVKDTSTSAPPERKLRIADPVWDFVVRLEGEPLARNRPARGRIVSELKECLNGSPPEELERRHEAIAREWGDAKATCRSLVNNWTLAGRIADGQTRGPAQQPKPGRVTPSQLYANANQPRPPLRALEEG